MAVCGYERWSGTGGLGIGEGGRRSEVGRREERVAGGEKEWMARTEKGRERA